MRRLKATVVVLILWSFIQVAESHPKGAATAHVHPIRSCPQRLRSHVAPSPATVYVDPNARLSGGTARGSFKHPFTYLRDALTFAAEYPETTIVLRSGTYKSSNNVNLIFSGLRVGIECATVARWTKL
jgi:hypothetical protein